MKRKFNRKLKKSTQKEVKRKISGHVFINLKHNRQNTEKIVTYAMKSLRHSNI